MGHPRARIKPGGASGRLLGAFGGGPSSNETPARPEGFGDGLGERPKPIVTGFGVLESGQLQAYNPNQAAATPTTPGRVLSPFKASKKSLLRSPGAPPASDEGGGGGFVSTAL